MKGRASVPVYKNSLLLVPAVPEPPHHQLFKNCVAMAKAPIE
jgi:hypothetical protein